MNTSTCKPDRRVRGVVWAALLVVPLLGLAGCDRRAETTVVTPAPVTPPGAPATTPAAPLPPASAASQ